MSLTLRHLNDDTSWLIIFNEFKILIDPWFFGSQTDYFRSFSTQEHSVKSAIEDVNRDLNIEINAIVISHEFTDHCHEQTLRSLSPRIPVFATRNACKLIRRWNYFEDVIEIPILDNQPEYFTLDKLNVNQSNRISIGYIPEKGFLSLPSLHGATCLSFLIDNQQWRSLLYIPHGCKQSSICVWLNKQKNVSVYILLQGFDKVYNPIWLGGIINYGSYEGDKLAIAVKARHWIATHDENKIAYGLVSRFLKRDYLTIENAQIELNKYIDQNVITTIHNVPNGDSLIIDLTI